MTIPFEPAFELREYEHRLEAVRVQMQRRSVDVLLLFSPSNIYYISGLDNDNYWDFQALVVPLEAEPILVMLGYESGRAHNSSWVKDLVLFGPDDDPVDILVATLHDRFPAASGIGVEQRLDAMTARDFLRLTAAMDDRRLVDPFGIVEMPRRRKSTAELAYMRRAAHLTDRGIEAGCAAIRDGARDTDVASAIMGALYDDDGETTCYGPIVAAGFRSGAPHSTFVGRRLRPGEPVFLELTGVVHRYTSPAMKTVIIGEPTREMLEISDRGGAALRNILEIARPGVTAVDVANRTIDVLGPILDGRLFHYRPGYSVGIGFAGSWVEDLGADITPLHNFLLEPGMTFHVIMSIREFGEFGINQSHTMVVTAAGSERLTETSPGLLVV